MFEFWHWKMVIFRKTFDISHVYILKIGYLCREIREKNISYFSILVMMGKEEALLHTF